MDELNFLKDFYDYYLLLDQNGLVIKSEPAFDNVSLPCHYLELLKQLFPNLSSETVNKIEEFYASRVNEKGINVRIKNKWYVLEYQNINGQEVFHYYQDHNALARFEKNLTLVQVDPLSNLLHKNAIAAYIDQSIENANVTAASLFMIDVDYFKNINDNYGHLFGDKVIVAVSDMLKKVHEGAKVGRIGGDEFVIFIEEDLDRDELKNIARLIRYYFDQITIGSTHFPLTATIGIVQYPKNGTTYEELYKNCDKALYRGKQKGRDCHIIYDPLMHDNITHSPIINTPATQVNVLSIAAFIQKITTTLIDIEAARSLYDVIFKDICEYFNLDRVVCLDETGVIVSHQVASFKDPALAYSSLNMADYAKYFVFDNSFMINDIQTLNARDPKLYDVFSKANVKSFIQVLLFDEKDNIVGFISYETINERRVWQTAELTYLTIISNLIKSFFVHKRKNLN